MNQSNEYNIIII